MAVRTVYETTYSFNKPKLLSEKEFQRLRTGLPIYPNIEDINSLVLKKYWWYIVCLFPPFFVVLIILPVISQGYFEPLRYKNALKEKNKYFINYYNSIYQSRNYEEYCKKNKELK